MGLHWTVVVLVTFQFLAHNAIERSWQAFLHSEMPPAGASGLTYLHIAAGLLVLILALLRIYLRMTRGAPGPPEGEPLLVRWLGEAVHVSIYLLLLLLPVTGSIAWFLGVGLAGDAHELLQSLLLAAIGLHVAGALAQHVIFRSDVVMRMLRPGRG